MSHPTPDSDRPLTDFLKHHRPTVPPAAADLEDRLMATVMDTPQVLPVPASRGQRPYRRIRWVLPSAIAAGLVAVIGHQMLTPPQLSDAELAELETFIESTWEGTLAEQPPTETEELYPLVDEKDVN